MAGTCENQFILEAQYVNVYLRVGRDATTASYNDLPSLMSGSSSVIMLHACIVQTY